MLLSDLIKSGYTPAEAIREMRNSLNKTSTALLTKSELFFEPLEKHQWRMDDVKSKMGEFGWGFARQGGNHEIWENPGVPSGHGSLRHGDMVGTLNPKQVKKYMDDLGLRWNQHNNAVEVDKSHKYYSHYQKMGFGEKLSPEMNTWRPPTAHIHVPIESVIHGAQPTEEWKSMRHHAEFRKKQAEDLSPIPVRRQGDQYISLGDPHRLEGAKRAGLTHVPVDVRD
jgi:hypothetical protein